MKWLLVALIAGHGVLHFLGAVEGFGVAPVSALTEPVSRGAGVGWLVAGVGMLLTAGMLAGGSSIWWAAGHSSVVLSQAMILTSWSDARFGTVANVVVLMAAACGLATQGPWSLRAEYRRRVRERLGSGPSPALVTDADAARLPDPVRRYLRGAGAIGQPRVTQLRATWRGRIRGTASDPWMTFTAEQHNFVDQNERLFFMRAKRGGLPVDVLHAFVDGAATMRVRLLSAFPIVAGDGPELTRAETVTILNDLCLLVPSALLGPGFRWEAADSRSARVHYSVGSHTVSATLSFNDADELIDFVSDDRLMASPDGKQFTRRRWSTPVSSHQNLGGRRVMRHGEGRWHPEGGGDFAYIELDLVELEAHPHDPHEEAAG
jgi:hypothetical protein